MKLGLHFAQSTVVLLNTASQTHSHGNAKIAHKEIWQKKPKQTLQIISEIMPTNVLAVTVGAAVQTYKAELM